MRAHLFFATICALALSAVAVPAQKPAGTPPPAAGGSVLDDINSVFGPGASKAPAPQAAAAAGGANASAGAIAKIGAAFEITGVRIGMPAAVAEKQVTTADPRFQPRPDIFTLTDMPGLQMTSGVEYVQSTAHTIHSLTLGLTLAPRSAAVWGIGRIQNFDENELPTVAATLQALRAKYGPEVARNDSPIQNEQGLVWILDENGNRVEGSQAKVIAQACATTSVNAQTSRTDVTNGFPSFSIDCSTYSFLTARLDEWSPTLRDRAGRLKGPGMLKELHLQAMCWPLRKASYLATTMAADRAREAREKGEKAKGAGKVPVL